MNIMITRQPIFDRAEKVLGYQLAHHDPSVESAEHSVLDALLEVGVEQVAKGGLAFLKASRELLLTGAVELLDPHGIVFVLDGAGYDPQVLDRCAELKGLGYHFAVDVEPALDTPEVILELSEVARVRVQEYRSAELAAVAIRLQSFRVHLLAEGVENASVRDRCLALGFQMFQGYEFNKPEVISKRDLCVEHLDTFRLLKDIKNPDIPDTHIIEAFHRNPNLTYKLLRVVNTAAVGGNGIDSIGHAVRLMGREPLARWLSLLLLSSIAGQGLNAEISSSAITRARLCEELADVTGRPWAADSLFTIGLFSRLDLLLSTPLEHIIEQIAFTENVRNALVGHSGPDGIILALVEAYERGEWDQVTAHCSELQIDPADLPRLYFDSLPWAEDRAATASGTAPAARTAPLAPLASRPAPCAPARKGLFPFFRSLLTGLRRAS